MDTQKRRRATRIGAVCTLVGSICMLLGAALWGTSGADIDAALDAGELGNYLATARESMTVLITNLSVWIFGVILIGAGATMMSLISTSRPVLAKLVQYNYSIAIPIVVISYVAWLSVVVRIAPMESPSAAELAELMGWFASRADWIATVLVLGTGPFLVSLAGKEDWVPGWLRIWSFIALFAGLLNGIGMYAGGLTSYGFIIIPVGMGWMIAASVVLFRKT